MKYFKSTLFTLFFFYCTTSLASDYPYTIYNETNETFTTVKIADPTIRDNHSTVYPGENTIDLYEDNNFIINMSGGWGVEEISVIVQPGKNPTCYPNSYRCSFDQDSVTIH